MERGAIIPPLVLFDLCGACLRKTPLFGTKVFE